MSVKLVKPSERYNQITKNANRLTKCIGVDILSDESHINVIIYVTITSLCAFLAFSAWTLIYEGIKDWRKMIEYATMISIAPQSCSKLEVGLRSAESIKMLAFLCRDIYKEYENKSEIYRITLDANIDRLERILKYILWGYFISFGAMILLPFIVFMLDGSRFAILQYHLPGLDMETTMGFYLTNLFQSISMIITAFGFYAADLFVIIFLMQTILFGDIFKLKINDLNEILEANNCCTAAIVVNDEKVVDALLIDLIKWHQFYMNYAAYVFKLSHGIIASQVLGSAFGITVNLFSQLALQGHVYKFVFLLLLIYSMAVYCLLGTQIEYTHDKFYNSAYSISWISLNVQQRKIYNLMLFQLQHPNNMKILHIIPLSITTMLELTKLIYSMIMMMTQFV